MTMDEALTWLSSGHHVMDVEEVRAVCDLFQVPFPDDLVMRWQSEEDALIKYGFVPWADEPGAGVHSLRLSYHVTRSLGLGAPGGAYIGRGSQAQANAQAIREWWDGLRSSGEA